jgi:DNA-binding Lrp family transcriptional regulator
MTALRDIDEVVECVAVAGGIDLLIQVVARDSDDLYRLGQVILRCPGIRRTATSIVLNELIGYRMGQLL